MHTTPPTPPTHDPSTPARSAAPTPGIAALARAVDEAVTALDPTKRWLLNNQLKRLARIRNGEVVPTRVELAAVESATGADFSAHRAALPPIDWAACADTASAVRAVREALGWDRKRLADCCDIDVSAVSRLESGRTTPRSGTAARLARAAELAGAPREFLPALGVRDATDVEALAALKQLGAAEIGPDTVVNGAAVGRWLQERMRELEAGTAPATLRHTLAALDVVSRRDVWMQRFGELQLRAASSSGALVFRRADPLESWVSDQRRAHEQGSMPDWKRELLESVPGWRWGMTKDETWMLSYARARQVIDEQGLTAVPRKYVAPDGFALGDWLHRARKRNAAALDAGKTDPFLEREALLSQLPE